MSKMESSGFRFERIGATSSTNICKTPTKTGTTICGLICSDGVVLGADTRSTNGETVADKNCAKIHFIAPNIYCCGAGTAADTEAMSGAIASELLLHRSLSSRQSKTVTALSILKSRLFKYQGHIGAALILGGCDSAGFHLFSIYPHGSSDALPYATMGSGSLAAMAVLESEFHEDLGLEEAKGIVVRAIKAGIFNDLASGSNVDLCVITQDGIQELRNYQTPNSRTHVCEESLVVGNQKMEVNRTNLPTATSLSLKSTT